MNPNKKFLWLAAGLLVLDQITKVAVKGFDLLGIRHDGMYIGESIPVLGDFFRLTFVENPGMAFGIGFGSGKLFLTLFSLLASVALTWYLLHVRTPSFWLRLGLALVLAGASGNLVDRMFYGVFYGEAPLFYGKVVDFFDFEFFDFSLFGYSYSRWPVFNIADACVTSGMVLLLLSHKHFPVKDTYPATDEANGNPDALQTKRSSGDPPAETTENIP